MSKRFICPLFILSLWGSSASHAQVSAQIPADIKVPEGYSLEITPPVYRTRTQTIPSEGHKRTQHSRDQKDDATKAPKAHVIKGPHITKSRKMKTLLKPSGYVLKNEKGEAVQTWEWIDGQLSAKP